MKKYLLSVVFVSALITVPLAALAEKGGHPGNQGNHYGWSKGGGNSHGVPDLGSTLSLLGMGMAAVGVGTGFWKVKRNKKGN